jgi:uncharacterized protein YdeI (YjbR/CyaY-like superfamily)
MNKINPQVDQYLIDGCMRCKFGGTPSCKVNRWRIALEALRQIVLDCGLSEFLKWGVPCYVFENKNIVMVSAFREYACLTFLKGSLLKDDHQFLIRHGENSQAFRIMKFTDVEQIMEKEPMIIDFIEQAINIERSGIKIVSSKIPVSVPDELLQKFDEYPELKRAFYALTPGRQRGYLLYFSQPVQPATRSKRIAKYQRQIMRGQGLNDNYPYK